MPSITRTFVAAALTSFGALVLGIGGDLMLAQSAPKQPSGYQTRPSSALATSVRVILPASAEPAQPPQQASGSSLLPALPVKEVQAPIQKQAGSAEPVRVSGVAEERRERRRRYAEHKARRMAASARELEQNRQRREPGILAFGGDDSRTTDFGN